MIINPKQCFAPSRRNINFTPVPRSQLNTATLADVICSFNPNSTKQIIQSNLNRHLNCPTNGKELYNSLLILAAYLYSPVPDKNDKILVTKKLCEGISQDTSGYHNRVNEALLILNRPQSIKDFLSIIRLRIVKSIARTYNKNVHQQNAFFVEAKCYGVEPISLEDEYATELTHTQARLLHRDFRRRYNVLNIFHYLLATLRSELAYYGYEGRKLEGSYADEEYNKIFEFLQRLGLDLELNNTFLQRKTDDAISTGFFNLNWPAVKVALWDTLIKNRYFILNKDEQLFFKSLHSNDNQSLEKLLAQKKYQELVLNLIKAQPGLLVILSKKIPKLSLALRMELFSTHTENGFNLLALAALYKKTTVKPLLESIKAFPLKIQLTILSSFESNICIINDYKKNFLQNAISKLNTNNEIERHLQTCLLRMSICASQKIAAVLDAYNSIKANKDALKAAINDPGSALYQALNMKRYFGFFCPNKETKSLQELRALIL